MKYSRAFDREHLVDILTEVGAVFVDEHCTCPYHRDANPSAGIFKDVDKHWRFRCFVCDITYDYYDIIGRRENLPIAEALRMEPAEEREKYVYDLYETALGEYTNLYEYFDTSGNLLVTKIRILNKENNKKSYRMITPYYGGFIRQAPEPPWPLYNQSGINAGGKSGLVIVEGEKCADALREMGFPVTTPLSSSSVHQTDWTPVFGKSIVIWPDPDKPGRKFAKQVEQKLTPHCPCVTTVDIDALGLKDTEDVVDYIEQGHGSADIRAVLLETAKHTPSEGVLQHIEGMIDGSISAKEWPWPLLHQFSQALLPGAMTLLVGPPGSSKSFFLMEALSHWIDCDIPVALHVLEENKTFHLIRALAQKVGCSYLTEPDWVHTHPDIARKAMTENKRFLDEMGKHLYAQPDKQINLSDIFSWMHEQLDAGCRIVAVDPITAAGRGGDIWKADEEFVLKSKKLADQYKASLVFVTHPTKLDANPCLNNIRGGAAWQQFTQNVFWLEKMRGVRCVEMVDSSMERANRLLHILKARNAREMESGVLAFMASGLKFHELGEFLQYEK